MLKLYSKDDTLSMISVKIYIVVCKRFYEGWLMCLAYVCLGIHIVKAKAKCTHSDTYLLLRTFEK